MKFEINIKKATLVKWNGADKISFHIGGISPQFPAMNYREQYLDCEVAHDHGEEWLQKNFPGLPVEVRDIRY